MVSNTGESTRDMWGSAADNIIGVGGNGSIVRYNGTAWSRMDSGSTETLNGVWGASGTDLFAVGNEGTIMQRSGGGWDDLKALAQSQGGFIQISASAYLRSSWGFYQAKCGELPDVGVDPDDRPDSSWQIFIGWDNKLYLFANRTICPFGDAAAMPIEALATKFRAEFEEHVGADTCPVAKRTLVDTKGTASNA